MNTEYYSTSPYNPKQYKHLDYSKASPERRYIKILKYFYDNPNTRKYEAVMKVFPDRPTVKMAWLSDKPAQIVRGYAMTFFGQLVNDELLKKEKDGKMSRFSITEKGIELLQKCGAI
jgi:hypothetical protein